MATAVVMPKQGQSVESCIIVEWKKSPGDSITEGVVPANRPPNMNEVMRLTKALDLKIMDQHFDNRCSMTVEIRQAAHAELIDQLGAIPSVTLVD